MWEIALVVLGLLTAPLPAPDQPLPTEPAAFAAALADTDTRLRGAVEGWDGTGAPPEDVTLLALYQQRLELELADRPRMARRTLPRLAGRVRAGTRAGVLAVRELAALSKGWPVKRRYRTGTPEPAARLERWYDAAHRRFGVSAELLAAVHLVESQFSRLRTDSVAGAQGPMQFIPATWRAYGLGGDVHDTHDAIVGAANYLRANGGATDEARALFHYNPSLGYVRAVLHHARRMRRDTTAFEALYARQVFVRSAGGGRRRITGP